MKVAQIPPHRVQLVTDEVSDICRGIRADQAHKTQLRCINRLQEM